MKKSYTIGRTPKELSAAVEIMIRNDFFDLEHFHAKHGGTEGHSFALRLSEETLEDTIFMDITAGERTTLTYTCSSEDESIPGLLAQLNQKISEVLDNAEYKEEIERLSEEKPQEAQEPEPAQRHDAEPSAPAAQPAAPFSWCKLIPLTLKIMSAVILLIGLFLAIQGAMSTSSYSSFYEIYPQTMTYFDAYFFFDTLLSWLCRSAVIFALGEIIDLLTHRHSD
ncbi:MAG: hypothetical protein U0M47_03100 [Merdibacter sp.]|nr:hypothetical protein [Merdibacter sp.]